MIPKTRIRRLIGRQKRRGVIKPLRGKSTPARKRLTQELWLARKRKGKIRGKVVEYGGLGTVPMKIYLQGISKQLVAEFQQSLNRQKKVRMLDIGPGRALFVQDLSDFRNAEKLEMHTISPEQINPKSVNGRPNLDHNPQLNHHVGAIETIDPRKLGTFDFIISKQGGIAYTPHMVRVAAKVGRMLARDGTAWLHFFEKRERTIEINSKTLQHVLGSTFEVQIQGHGYSGLIYIKRKK